jgi:hypothetical protein
MEPLFRSSGFSLPLSRDAKQERGQATLPRTLPRRHSRRKHPAPSDQCAGFVIDQADRARLALLDQAADKRVECAVMGIAVIKVAHILGGTSLLKLNPIASRLWH